MVKLFITGATGYIGGDALYTTIKAHPDYDITCLVRNSKRGALLKEKYPAIRLVYGDLDDHDLIVQESSKADIVCNWANCEHVGCVRAIAQGLSQKPADEVGYFIHLSGSDILCFPDVEADAYGVHGDKVFDDWDGVGELTSMKDIAAHQEVDMVVLKAGASTTKSAIVCPPTIYGPGRGPGNKRSIQVPTLVEYTLKRGAGLTVEAGQNIWSVVHVQDLSKLFLTLIEESVRGGGVAGWGNEGYYFAENGEACWADIATRIAEEAQKQGYIGSTKLERLDKKVADGIWEYATFFWGTNSRCKAIRARKLLKWSPTEHHVFDEIPRLVAAEAKVLGL
ncbi:hypothetical protein BKA61DRAFT_646614 [Leptodontidium sp. MPI-SDFR-AT-0119]|nr:hypothetical protein BKA61DRAFT_646614 [Leptodontidium sp. MPI-SDFR-AT-0119]